MSRWPSVKPSLVKMRHTIDHEVQSTIDITTGYPLVEMRPDTSHEDPTYFTPREARSLARALVKHADVADRKRDDRTKLRRTRNT